MAEADRLRSLQAFFPGSSLADLRSLMPSDIGGMMPEAYADPNVGIAPVIKGAVTNLATLPQRAIENSQFALGTGTYDPGPTLEASSLAMMGGVGGTGAGGVSLGSGPVRSGLSMQPQVKVMRVGKDSYNIVDSQGNVLANADIGIVNIDGKRLAQIDDINTPALNNVTTQAEHDAAVAAGRNVLGTGHMREAMRQFLEMHPDVEGFTGNRVSGARNSGMMSPANIQNITVKVP